MQYSAQPSHDTTTVAATRHAGAGLGAQEGVGGGRARGWVLGVRGALGWARRQAHANARQQAGSAGARARRQARGRTPASRAHRRQAAGAGGTGVRALGSRGRARQAAGAWQGAAGARPERWARGLALGYALGVLDLFLARFDSVFS